MQGRRTLGGGRLRAGALAFLVGVAGLTVATTQPAHAAFTPCSPATCIAASDDSYVTTVSPTNNAFIVPASIGLLANDRGLAGTVVSIPDSDDTSWWGDADISINSNGSFSYKPNPNFPFTGIDSFDYTIRNGSGDNLETDWATAYVEVRPAVRTDNYSLQPGASLTVPAASGVLANDDGVAEVFTADDVTAQGVSITVESDGSFTYTPPSGFSGLDTFEYDVWDLNDDNDYTATVNLKIDGAKPVFAFAAPTKRVTMATTTPVSWSGTDGGTAPSGIANYTVQRRSAPYNGGFTSWAAWKTDTTAKSSSVGGLTQGRTYCFRGSARDRAANVSSFTGACTTIPLKSTSLTYSGSWSTSYRSDVYAGVQRISKTKGAWAKRTGVKVERLYLIATKCPTCGVVQVRFNNVVVYTANLYASSTLRKQLISAKAWPSVQSGTVTVHVTSPTGKSVNIEGLGIYVD